MIFSALLTNFCHRKILFFRRCFITIFLPCCNRLCNALIPSHFEIIWQETKLTDLGFTDDLALLTNNGEEMQLMADSLKNLSRKFGLRISVDKTKMQKIGNLESNADIFLDGAPLEVVENVPYLGSIQSNVGDIEKEVRIRIGKEWSVFRRLQTVWGSKVISLTVKCRLYNSTVLSTALYACGTCKVTTKITNLLDVFQLSCLSKILRYLGELK